MGQIARMVLTSLSLFLGMFFFFFGLIKVSRTLNSEIHREMRRNFVRYAKVVPLFTTHFGWKVSPKIYRLLVGYSEIITGLLLAFCPGRIKQLVNLFLICLTIGAIYTHLAVDDDYNKMIPAIAFCSMLTTRLILYCLLKRIDQQPHKISSPMIKSRLSESDQTSYSEDIVNDEKMEKIEVKSNEKNKYLMKTSIFGHWFNWFATLRRTATANAKDSEIKTPIVSMETIGISKRKSHQNQKRKQKNE